MSAATLVERLREEADYTHKNWYKVASDEQREVCRALTLEAADRIAALTAERDKLAEALRKCRETLVDWHEMIDSSNNDSGDTVFGYCRECGTVEYRDHKPHCAYIKMIAELDALLSSCGCTKGGA